MKHKATKFVLLLGIGLLAFNILRAQNIPRPPIWGIAKTTFLVSDMQATRAYYSEFLGFEEAFSYPSPLGEVVSFKVNDRQFLEFIEDKDAKGKNRLVSVSLETSPVEQMRLYLQSQGVEVPLQTSLDHAGNEVFTVADNDGNPIEFINFNPDGLHRKSKGKNLSDRRVSKRIHHAGLYTATIEEQDVFWVKALKCTEIVRSPEDKSSPAVIRYLSFVNSTECIEHYSPSQPDFAHPCLLVEDMQEAIYMLKERASSSPLPTPNIGRGNRWLLNLRDTDNNRIEFTESFRLR